MSLLRSHCSRFSIGTAQLGQRYGVTNTSAEISAEQAIEIFNFAASIGINHLDTAMDYGRSESMVGQSKLSRWQIQTKLPECPESCHDVSKWVKIRIESSLEKLKIECIDSVLLHDPLLLLSPSGKVIWETLNQLKTKGLIRYTGFSIYNPDELEKLMTVFHPDILQTPFNIFDQRLISSGWLTKLKKKHISVQARSAFLQGTLLHRQEKLPAYFKPWKNLWKNWFDWLERHHLTAAEACLNFILSQKDIDTVIIGVDSLAQLQQLAALPQRELPALPESLPSNDENLINPGKWSVL